MKISCYIVLFCWGFWALIAWLLPDLSVSWLLGMLAPMAMALGSVLLMERAHRRGPVQLMDVLVKGFVIKMVLSGAYVMLVSTLNVVQAAPFAISFTVCFLGLHSAGALYLRTLLENSGDKSTC